MEQDLKAQAWAPDSNFNHDDRKEESSTTTTAPVLHTAALHPLAALPSLRKNVLYLFCCLAVAADCLVACALVTATEIIARDQDLTSGGNAVWILSASAMAFAACIPLGGRLADVSPPQWWFVGGSLGVSCFALGNSFVIHNKALFLALRALQGICAALSLPSCFAMIVLMYPNPVQQRTRLIAVSLMISLGMAGGFIVGAVLVLASWRWIFRFIAIVAFICGTASWLLLPHQKVMEAEESQVAIPWSEKIRRLDLVGVCLIIASLLLLNLSLTNATVYGWDGADFIAPFVIGFLLIPTFCLWEAKQDVQYAMLPVAIMKQGKFLVVCFSGMFAEMWFCTTQLGPSRFYQEVLHDKTLIVGAKLVPQVLGCVFGGLLHTFYVSSRIPPKYTLLVGMLICVAPGTILIIVSGGGRGIDYWKYMGPGTLIGAFFMIMVWDAANVSVIQAVPSNYSGIASSVFLMFVLTGAAMGTPIQAAFYTAAGNDLADWRGSQYGFCFVAGCIAVVWLSVLIWLPAIRPLKEDPRLAETPVLESQSPALGTKASSVSVEM